MVIASIIILSVCLLTPSLISGLGVDYYNADWGSELIPLIISEERGAAEPDLQLDWCYLHPSCDESSPASAWQEGTCKFGQRQSPINIQTDNLTPSKPGKRRRRRRKRRVLKRSPREANFYTIDNPGSIRRIGPYPDDYFHGGIYGGIYGGNYGGTYGGIPGGIHGGIYGGIPGGIYGGIPGGIYGGIHGGNYGGNPGGIYGGIPGGIYGGIPGGIPGGNPGGIYGGIHGSIHGGNYYKPRPYPYRPYGGYYGDYYGMPPGVYAGQKLLDEYENGTPIKHVELPSKVEQGLLCSRQPHWNLMWVNRKPFRYWIRMHLCRLMLHQTAKFQTKPREVEVPMDQDQPKEITVPFLRSRYTAPEDDDEFLGPNFQFRRSLGGSKPRILDPSETESILQKIGPPPVKLDFSECRGNYEIQEFQVFSNGRTLEISGLVPESGTEPSFQWAEQNNGVYKLEKVVFHWGPTDDLGSEHTVDGRAYAAEMQLVHYRTTQGDSGFPDFMSAVMSGQSNAVAVIAVFLDVNEDLEEESVLGEVLEEVAEVLRNGDSVPLSLSRHLRLDKVLENATEAYHYMGSFTTPKCEEVVAWLVMKEPVYIQKKDIEALRESMKEDDEPLKRNFRSVQNNSQPVTMIGIKQ